VNVLHPRRGVALILVLVVIGLLGGLMAVIAANTSRHLRERQTDRVRQAAVAIADSVAAYVRHWPHLRATTQPSRAIEFNVADITPELMTSQARLTFPEVDGRAICRIHVSVSSGAHITTRTHEMIFCGQQEAKERLVKPN